MDVRTSLTFASDNGEISIVNYHEEGTALRGRDLATLFFRMLTVLDAEHPDDSIAEALVNKITKGE